MTIKNTAALLQSNDGFLIVTHLNPDGDTVGSSAALCSALRRIGKTAYLFNNPQISSVYDDFLPENIFAPSDFIPSYIIAVDVADVQLFPKGFNCKVDLCIDHHPTNSAYAADLLLDAKKSSCGEIINKVISALGLKLKDDEATLLYIALSTDTGCFRYNNTRSESFLAASAYTASGADIFKVNKLFFNNKSPRRARLEGYIYSGIEYFFEGRLAVAVITLDDLARSGADESDMDNLAGLVSCIDGTVITATIREIENGACKISLRSDVLDCSNICENFGGGGHRAAAGCTIHASTEQSKSLLIDVLEGML